MMMYSDGGSGDKKATVTAFISGLVLASGWWIVADAGVQGRGGDKAYKFEHLLPAFFSLLGLWLLNAFPWSGLTMGDPVQASRCKMALFASVAIYAGCIFGSLWVLIGHFDGGSTQGISQLICTLSAVAAGVICRMGRMDTF